MLNKKIDENRVMKRKLDEIFFIEKGKLDQIDVLMIYCKESQSQNLIKNVTPNKKVIINNQVKEVDKKRPFADNREVFQIFSNDESLLFEIMVSLYFVTRKINPGIIRPIDEQMFEVIQESYISSWIPSFFK